MDVDLGNQAPLAPLPLGDRHPLAGSPQAPPGTGEAGQPGNPEPSRNPFEALMDTAKLRGFLFIQIEELPGRHRIGPVKTIGRKLLLFAKPDFPVTAIT